MVEPLIETEHLKLASIADIGCMKLGAIMSRYAFKDYVDLFVICKQIPLPILLAYARQKYPNIDTSVYLKNLSYFGDVKEEELLFYDDFSVNLSQIEIFFAKEIKQMYPLS